MQRRKSRRMRNEAERVRNRKRSPAQRGGLKMSAWTLSGETKSFSLVFSVFVNQSLR